MSVQTIDAHTRKSRGGDSSDFWQNSLGVNAFRTKLPGGPLFWVLLLHFFDKFFFKFPFFMAPPSFPPVCCYGPNLVICGNVNLLCVDAHFIKFYFVKFNFVEFHFVKLKIFENFHLSSALPKVTALIIKEIKTSLKKWNLEKLIFPKHQNLPKLTTLTFLFDLHSVSVSLRSIFLK
jgi:hypothetical protein